MIAFTAWFVLWFLAMSFIEHFAHRYIMHRRCFLHRRFRAVSSIYFDHTILHHRRYYKIFNDESDPFGRVVNIRFELLPSLPIALVWAACLMPFSLASSVAVLLAIFAHHALWNVIHWQMHNPDPSGRFFSEWRIFRYLERYHWMHHRYPGKNYNVVLPLADFCWGTHIVPSARDVEQMEAIGI